MTDFHTAMFQANLQYGLELQEEDFEEIGLIAWQRIGNKRVRTYRYCTTVSCDGDHSIELPCNADIIEAVTYGFEDWNYTDNILPNGDINSALLKAEKLLIILYMYQEDSLNMNELGINYIQIQNIMAL